MCNLQHWYLNFTPHPHIRYFPLTYRLLHSDNRIIRFFYYSIMLSVLYEIMEAYCYYGVLLFYVKQWNISDVEKYLLVIIKTLELKTLNNLIHFKFSFIGNMYHYACFFLISMPGRIIVVMTTTALNKWHVDHLGCTPSVPICRSFWLF